MVRVSLEESILLLAGWKEQGIPIGAAVRLREDGREEHNFWAKIVEVTEDKLSLAGEHALVEVPFEPNGVCEYSEVAETSERLRERFPDFEFCLTIRSQSVLALLFGGKPKTE